MLDRLVLPDEGTISLGGVELNALADPQLRRSVALVFQEPFLFAGSVLDNIDLGAGLGHDAIARATAIAQVDEFVDDLPHGWSTVIGERGVTLSGGQRPAHRARPRPRAPAPAAAARRRHLQRRPDDRGPHPHRPRERAVRHGHHRSSSPSLDDRAGRRRALHRAGRVAGYGSHRELLRPCGGVPPPGRVVRQGSGEPMSAPADTFDPIADGPPASVLEIMRRGWRASPELRDGVGITILLASVGAAGRVVIPVLVQQLIDKGFNDGKVDVARVVSLSVAGAVIAVVATVCTMFAAAPSRPSRRARAVRAAHPRLPPHPPAVDRRTTRRSVAARWSAGSRPTSRRSASSSSGAASRGSSTAS